MKKVRLNESDIENIVRKIIKEDNGWHSSTTLEGEREKWLSGIKKYRLEDGDEYIEELEQLTNPIEFFKHVIDKEGVGYYDLPDSVNDALENDGGIDW
jgi:hypothetical protein